MFHPSGLHYLNMEENFDIRYTRSYETLRKLSLFLTYQVSVLLVEINSVEGIIYEMQCYIRCILYTLVPLDLLLLTFTIKPLYITW